MLQKKIQVFLWIQFVSFFRFYHRIDFHAGICLDRSITKQSGSARASAIVYMLVKIAKANGVNVYHKNLPNERMSDEELKSMTP